LVHPFHSSEPSRFSNSGEWSSDISWYQWSPNTEAIYERLLRASIDLETICHSFTSK
jgi:hypothetical protein